MDDYRTETYEPEADPDYDWDYEDTGPPPPKILWGRVAAFAGAPLVALLIGLWAAPNGIPEEDLAAVKQERDALQGQVADLRDQAEGLQGRLDSANQRATRLQQKIDQGGIGTTIDPQPTNIREYVIERGDSLSKIAQQVYGDAELATCLADFNDIANQNQLEIGSRIFLPPENEVCD